MMEFKESNTEIRKTQHGYPYMSIEQNQNFQKMNQPDTTDSSQSNMKEIVEKYSYLFNGHNSPEDIEYFSKMNLDVSTDSISGTGFGNDTDDKRISGTSDPDQGSYRINDHTEKKRTVTLNAARDGALSEKSLFSYDKKMVDLSKVCFLSVIFIMLTLAERFLFLQIVPELYLGAMLSLIVLMLTEKQTNIKGTLAGVMIQSVFFGVLNGIAVFVSGLTGGIFSTGLIHVLMRKEHKLFSCMAVAAVASVGGNSIYFGIMSYFTSQAVIRDFLSVAGFALAGGAVAGALFFLIRLLPEKRRLY